ncbi:MAG: cell division protein FtsX [marine bacterium B5-7]|nr:MAG: cell division protein FtsX [marine bacterium B5-7]
MRFASAHLQAARRALAVLTDRPFSSMLTLAGIGVALAVPMVLYTLVYNLTSVFQDVTQGPRLSIYMERSATPQRVHELVADIADDTDIESVHLIDREQGLDELLRASGLESVRDRFETNPLVDVIEVNPRSTLDPQAYRDLADRLAAIDGVDEVNLDFEWLERLKAITDLAMIVVRSIWLLLFAAVALVIANSVRLGLVTAREEIEVISLVGGSEAFIRRPYLYNGLIKGLTGALFALGFAWIIYMLMSAPLGQLLQVYLGGGEVNFLSFGVIWRVIAASAALGWLSSWATVSRFLATVLPR